LPASHPESSDFSDCHGVIIKVSDVGNMTRGCFSRGVFALYFYIESIVEYYPGPLLEREKSFGK